MKQQYYEAHVTMLGDPVVLRPIVERYNWEFSAIDGDPNLGDGIKCYATTQYNERVGKESVVCLLKETATSFAKAGGCVECVW